ncbi:protein toll [Phlebotomus argentipes]|uniref:protein toll n=1 Tax=Phlebotomus argentipes TaxID=94469 RepID=UPI002892F6DA|nr:protein toll [Phlebotomus argentipes]
MIRARLVAVILLVAGTTAADFLSQYEAEEKHEVCKTTCDCYSDVDKYVLECPRESSTIRVSYPFFKRPVNYVDISCSVADEEYKSLPNITIEDVSQAKISSCELPRSASIMSVLNRLGVRNINTLFINNARQEFRNKLIRQHLSGFDNLTRLVIGSSHITQIPDDLFDDVPNIKWLSLKINKIHSIESAFAKLPNLEFLELGENDLHTINEGTFRNNSQLKSLNLWTNKLKNLTKDVFIGVQSLQTLDLSYNQIESFHPDVFDLLPNLTVLHLNKNNFHELPAGLLKNNRKLSEFTLLYNQGSLKEFPAGFFANLTALASVDIRSALETLPSDVFSGSEKLRKLNLSYNKLVSLPLGLLATQRSLEELNLSHNKLSALDVSLFESTVALIDLNLANNSLTHLARHLFTSLHNLKRLYLNNNQLKTIPMDTFATTKSLEVINMANNQLTFMENQPGPIDLNSPFQHLTKLTDLNLSRNQILRIFQDWLFNLSQLQRLDLSYNNITLLTANDLQFLSRKITVYLTHNQISEISMYELESFASGQDALNSPHEVPTIYLDGNPVVCNCLITYFVRLLRHELDERTDKMVKIVPGSLTCAAPPQHAGKLVASVNPHDLFCDYDTDNSQVKRCPAGCQCLVRTADLALLVNCSNAGLSTVPVLPEPTNSSLKYIILYLENNSISNLPRITDIGYDKVRHLFVKNNNITSIVKENLPPQLESLDLRNNNMIHINETVLKAFNNTRTLRNISLSNNPWKCNCEALSLMIYIQSQFKKVNDYDYIECSDGQRINKMVPGDICTDDVQAIVALSITLALLGILIGILAALYYKYQQEIKIWMYWHNICPFIFNSDALDANKKYDAFISYSHKDEDFVADTLVPELEMRRKFNLCIHRRDWTVGDFIPDQIIRSVAESRRTIIVLSPNYVESVWGTMEFRTAHHTAVKENVSRVIVIMYGDVDRSNIDPELKSYIDMNTYIEWGDAWFWERLHYALRTVKTSKGGGAGALFKTSIKSSVDDKLELIHPSPITPPSAASPVDSPKLNGSLSYARNGKVANGGLNGHVNGAFIINTNSKQSDV